MRADFEATANIFLELADRSLDEGNYPDCIDMLKSALKKSGDVSIGLRLFDVYCDIGLLKEAEQVLVDLYCVDDSVEILMELYHLAETRGDNFAGYQYFGEIARKTFFSNTEEDFRDVFEEAIDRIQDDDYRLVIPFEDRVEKGISLISTDMKAAYELLDSVPETAESYIRARNNIAFIKYLKGDNNSAYNECEYILTKDRNNVAALSMMLSISAMEKETEKCEAIAAKINSLSFDDYESVSKVAVSMCEAGMHADAVKYFEKINIKYDRNIDLLMSIALYNCGRSAEAIRKLKNLHKIYGRHCPALFFIKLMQRTNPPIPYIVHETYDEIISRKKQVEELLADRGNLSVLDERIDELIYWVFKNVSDELVLRDISACLARYSRNTLIDELLKDVYIMDFGKKVLIEELINNGSEGPIKVYINGRVIKTKPEYPVYFPKLEETIKRAYAVAFSEAAEQTCGFEKALADTLRKFVVFYRKNNCRFRSVATVTAILLVECKALESFGKFEDVKPILNINKKTYAEYIRKLKGNNDEID